VLQPAFGVKPHSLATVAGAAQPQACSQPENVTCLQRIKYIMALAKIVNPLIRRYRSAWRHGMNHPFIAAIRLNTTYQRNPRLLSLDTTIYEH